jgi:hypothetical protein
MNDQQRIQLQNMISKHNVSDQTDLIRQLQHSRLIRDDVNKLVKIVQAHYIENDETSAEKIKEEGVQQCSFLFRFYTDIFNKIRTREINLEFLYRALFVLEKIENNEVGQHEASFEVGMILKEMYLDSAVRKADKLNNNIRNENNDNNNSNNNNDNTHMALGEQEKHVEKEEIKDITWAVFKKQKLKLLKKMNNKKQPSTTNI